MHALQASSLFLQQGLHGSQLAFEQVHAAPQHWFDTIDQLSSAHRIGGGLVLASEVAPRCFGLQELLDLGEAQANHVSELLDQRETFDIVIVVAAVCTGCVCSGLEQPKLFVIPNGPRGEPSDLSHFANSPQAGSQLEHRKV